MVKWRARSWWNLGFGPQRAGDYLEPVAGERCEPFDSWRVASPAPQVAAGTGCRHHPGRDEACDSADTIPLSNALENRVLPWLQSLSELISLWHETVLAGSRSESTTRFPEFRWMARIACSSRWFRENVLVFGGFLFHGRAVQIEQNQEPVNRREEGIDLPI